MAKVKYFINNAICKSHNKKTKILAEQLSQFDKTIIEFDKDFTPEIMLEKLKAKAFDLNMKYNGGNIEVNMQRGKGIISYSYHDGTNGNFEFAYITLMSVSQTINKIEQL